ncbi:hypothetical protein [Providencia manganoxydans]|uniref:hypothetical protein n=1 Tax=Providencia manganoxydans TaxID=2923283 RepID=UPI0034E3A99C
MNELLTEIAKSNFLLMVIALFTLLFATIFLSIIARFLVSRLINWEKKNLSVRDRRRVNSIYKSVILDMRRFLPTLFISTERRGGVRRNVRREIEVKKDNDSKDINYYIESEYSTAKLMRSIFVNIFVIFTIFVIFFFFYFDSMSAIVRGTLAIVYFSFSMFTIYIIKTCYKRSSLMISLLEDIEKKNEIHDFLFEFKKGETLTENDIDFIKIIKLSRAERERSVNHPYEIILKNLSGYDIDINKKGIKLKREENKK